MYAQQSGLINNSTGPYREHSVAVLTDTSVVLVEAVESLPVRDEIENGSTREAASTISSYCGSASALALSATIC